MKKSLMILSLMIPNLTLAVDCASHPIYCNILTLKPSVNRTFAMELSNYIGKYSRQFKTDPRISVAIAMQESSLINQDRHGAVLKKNGTVVHGISDVGLFQLHVNTIDNMRQGGWDIDLQRLRTDVEYQTYWHVRLLRKKIDTCVMMQVQLNVSPGDEWSCYHSYTYGHREIYKHKVAAHLNKLQ